ncbi:MAG: hypothetical protein Q7S74_02380 [Nanoarchaeota archaeon]|nr:hypothetical protein [Nanoarchaeota archaeon]
MEETCEIQYEKESDFLEVLFGEPSKCIASEVQEGVFVRKDIKTGEVKSIGILGFKKKTQLLKTVLASFNKELPLEIGVSSN